MLPMTDQAAPARPRWIEYLDVDELVPNPENPKGHADAALAESLERFGYTESVSIDERTGMLSAGHGRREMVLARRAAGLEPPEGIVVEEGRWLVPVERGWSSVNDIEAKAYLVASNELTNAGGWIDGARLAILNDLATSPLILPDSDPFAGLGYSAEQLKAMMGGDADSAAGGADERVAGSLAARFLVPPFSVLDARQGYWQDRKRAWLGLGIRSEEGRAHNLLKMSDTVLESQQPAGSPSPNRSVPNSHSGNDPAYYWKKQEAERQAGRQLSNEEFEADWLESDAYVGGTSIFDPVLCEIAYRWWCPPGGRVLDPFAGGSVRGIVAGRLGLAYRGIDLRAEQIVANEDQRTELAPDSDLAWEQGDAALVLANGAWEPEPFDLLFSCPPYFDLEQYSQDPADLSNAASYAEFLTAYRTIIQRGVERLAPNRFAVFVVGDIRGPSGSYRGFVPDTIRAFEDAGAGFYNEAILVTAVGSLALRAARIFGGGRKVGKAHQNVLVFVKGDGKAAAEACGVLELPDPAELFGEVLEA